MRSTSWIQKYSGRDRVDQGDLSMNIMRGSGRKAPTAVVKTETGARKGQSQRAKAESAAL
jgi:hypothetical protein